ncbi:hypothetical protein IWX50DRAFT_647844 [Phyllosticta citricarpa]
MLPLLPLQLPPQVGDLVALMLILLLLKHFPQLSPQAGNLPFLLLALLSQLVAQGGEFSRLRRHGSFELLGSDVLVVEPGSESVVVVVVSFS